MPVVTYESGLGYVANDGVDLGVGSITQNITTVPGERYVIQFVMYVNNTTHGEFVIGFNNISYILPQFKADLLPFTLPLPPGSPIQQDGGVYIEAGTYIEEFSAFATSTSTPIEFASSCPGCDMAITDVSVIALPEPPAFALFSIGLLAFGAFQRSCRERSGALDLLAHLPHIPSIGG